MTDHQQVREALELAFEETDSCIVANKCQKALEALSRLEAAAAAEYERGRQDGMKQEHALWQMQRIGQEIEAAAVPELSREDVVRLAREAGFEETTYGLNDTPGMYAYNMEIIQRFASLVRSVPVGEVKPVATFRGRRLTPEGTSEFWGSLLCDQSSDPPSGALLYTSPPPSESPCQFAIDNGGNLYRRYREPACAACVPAKKETDKWESARVADFNAGWNACRAAVLTTPPATPEGWRPIETAPKDHGVTNFDVWARGERVADCWWGTATYDSARPRKLGIAHLAAYDSDGPVVELVKDATHWMPLPAAPQPGDKA